MQTFALPAAGRAGRIAIACRIEVARKQVVCYDVCPLEAEWRATVATKDTRPDNAIGHVKWYVGKNGAVTSAHPV